MLTILHPEAIPLVHELQMGLFPLRFDDDDRPKLVIKASKEAILTAKLNQGFKIYAVPVFIQNKPTLGLVTAFFDDGDEPIIVFTPMFEDSLLEELRRMLLCDDFDVHFFDENNRELLGYNANTKCESSTRNFIEHAELLPFEISSAKSSFEQMNGWFGLRNHQDDLSAISVVFASALFPEDLVILDHRLENHTYHGSQPFNFSHLVRQEPGLFQEHDIVELLLRVFPPEQIYLGPLRVTDHEEIADVLVVTDSQVLFIQAKDSPNTEGLIRNSVIRKKATAKKSLTKAVDQTRGAFRYARSMTPMRMLANEKEVELALGGRELYALVVIKELFNDEYSTYSPVILSLAEEIQTPCIVLDYSELHKYTANLNDEKSFFEACSCVFAHGIQTGVFPRLRFGLSDSD